MAESKESSSSAEDNAGPGSFDLESWEVVNSIAPQDQSPLETNSECILQDPGIRRKENEKLTESLSSITSFTRKTGGTCLIKLDNNKTYHLPFVLSTNFTQPEVKIVKGIQYIKYESVLYTVTKSTSGSPNLKNQKTGEYSQLYEVYSTGDGREESIERNCGSSNEFRQTSKSHIEKSSVMGGTLDKSKTCAGVSPGVNTIQKLEGETKLTPDFSQTRLGDSEQRFNNNLSGGEITEVSVEQREKTGEKPMDETCLGELNESKRRYRKPIPSERKEKIPNRETSVKDSHLKDGGEIDPQPGINNDGDSEGESDNIPGQTVTMEENLSYEATNITDENRTDQQSSGAHSNQAQERRAASTSTDIMASTHGERKRPAELKDVEGGDHAEAVERSSYENKGRWDAGDGSKKTMAVEVQSDQARAGSSEKGTGLEASNKIQEHVKETSESPGTLEIVSENTQVLKLWIKYFKKQGKKAEADFSKHLVSCCLNFHLMWNFYTQTDCGRKMLDVITGKHHCKVSLPADEHMKEFFTFHVLDEKFQEESDVKNFVDCMLDKVYISAQESLSIDLIGIDLKILEDLQEKIKERKELDCSWIQLIGEGNPVTVYTVCHKDHQQLVMQIITELITDATKLFDNHKEIVTVDFIWQMVMTRFEYLRELGLKFPSTEIINDKNLNAFLLKGPRDEVKAAAGHLKELIRTAHKEVHQEIFSPGYQFEIFALSEMCDYIDNSLPKLPVVWIPNHVTKEIHLFSRDPKQLKGIDKSIKGCIEERFYPLSKDRSRLPLEKLHSVEKLKKKHKGKIVLRQSESPTGLCVTTADDIFKGVDAAVMEIIRSEIDEVHLETCVPVNPNGRDGQLHCKPKLSATDPDKEMKDLFSEKVSDSGKKITRSLEVKDENLFRKLSKEIEKKINQIAKEHCVSIEESVTQSRFGFVLKGLNKEVQHIFEIIREEEKQIQSQDISDVAGAGEKVHKQMTPGPNIAGKSRGSKLPASTSVATITTLQNNSTETMQPATTRSSETSATSLPTTTSSIAISTSPTITLTQSAGTSITQDTSSSASAMSTAPAIRNGATTMIPDSTCEAVMLLTSNTMESSTSSVLITSSSLMTCTSQTTLVTSIASATSVPAITTNSGTGTTSSTQETPITTANTSATAKAEEPGQEQREWSYPNGKKITLLKAGSCDAEVIIIPGNSDKDSHFHFGDKKIVRLKVPDWTEGKAKTDLQQAIKQVLDKILEKTVGICIKTMEGWNFHRYLKCFLYEIYMCFMRKEGKPCPIECVFLLVDDEPDYSNAIKIIQESFKSEQDMSEVAASQKLVSQERGSIFKSIRVKVQKGQLHETQAEVLVNTVNRNLDLTKGAISSSLLLRTGSGIQKELQQHKGKYVFGQVLKTGVGSLPKPCKAIFHGVLYGYKEHDYSFKVFEDFILGCLEDANKKYNSIAFPPIGTGKLRYPKDLVASIMFQSVAKFEHAHSTSKLKDVIFVIYEKDQETLKVFEELYGKCVDATAADQLKAVPTDKYVSKVLKYGPVQAQAKLGTFENESQNCLMVLWEKQCLHKISDKNPILQSAGSTVTQKWKDHKNSRQFHQDAVLVTQGGNLRYTEIIHVASDINNIKNAAKAGLMKADSEKMKTLVVPITKDDVLSRDAQKFCREILKAVNELATELKFVQSVTLVVQGQHNFPFFNDVFEQESRMYGAEKKIGASKNNDMGGKKTVQSPISAPPDTEPLVQQISLNERGLNPKTQQQLMKGTEVFLAGHKIQLGLTDEEKCCIILSGDIKSKQDLVEIFSNYHDHSNKVKCIVYPYEEKSALVIFEKEVDFKTLEVCTKPFRVEPIFPLLLQNLEFLLPDALVERAYNSGQMERMTTSMEEKSGVRIKKTNNQVFVCAVTVHQMVIAKHYLEDFCEKRLSIKINDIGKNMSSNTQDEESRSYSDIDKLNEVSEVEFKALEILENSFKRMENIQLSWDKNDAILIQGPPGLTVSIKQHLSKQLEVLRTKQFEDIFLDEEEKNVVKDVIEKTHSEDTICVYDEKKSQVVVYSDKQDDIMKFKHKLKFRSGKVKETGRSKKRFTAINESQATEASNEDFRSSFRSGGLGKQFSWSNDALDKAVFYTKENIKVSVYKADILNLPVDCIVNAANDKMQHGGGVAKVIADAAGYKLVQEGDAIIREKGKIPVGVQVTTTAGKLNYKCVIHTVGPCWSDYQPHNFQKVKDCEKDLYAAIHGCFLEAEKNGCSTVALPAVSSGIYAVPQDMCVVQYAKAVLDYSRKSEPGKSLTEIHFVDRLPHLVKLIQDTFRTMLQDGKEPNYNVNDYVISSSGYQRKSDAITVKGHQSHEHHQHGQPNAGNSSHHGLVEKIDFSPVYYESEEYGKKRSVFQISPKPVVRIYKGNVLEVKGMDAVICPDDKNGSGSWNIASELKRKEKYKKQKEAGFKLEKPGLGDVVVTYAGEHSYHVIFHVVIETYETKKSDFESVMRKCIDNMLKKAHELVLVKKIAVPLFGVKTGYLTEESWAKLFLDRFVAFCCEFQNPDLEEIHIVTHFLSSSAYDKVKKIFHDYYDETSRDQNKKNVHPPRPPLPCGYGTDNIGIQESSSEKGHGSAGVEVNAADDCVICMCPMSNPRPLPCGHSFCAGCVDELFKHKPVCPACGKIVGILTGDQPKDGRIDVKKSPWQLAGYEGHGSIQITYTFSAGRQGPSHPTPGAFYGSMARTAFLPDTHEGRTVCRMLQLAFERRLVFTISQSRTTGKEGLTWNDIHHKTNRNPGTEFGYPDPDYLSRVKEELASKGITEADVPPEGTGSFKDSTKR